MEKIKRLSEYMFFRMVDFYHKIFKGQESKVAAHISFLQAILLADIILFPYKFFIADVGEKHFPLYFKAMIILVFFSLGFYNHKALYPNYWVFRKRWLNEDKKLKRRNGYLILIIIFLVPFTPLLVVKLINWILGIG